MTDRDAKLLPRLLATLDTLENEAEIAATVRLIRRIVGRDWFGSLIPPVTALPTGQISLSHPEHDIAIRLRGLGLMLRLVVHPSPEVGAAVQRTSAALVVAGLIDEKDLVITLACLRDLLESEARRQVEAENPPMPRYPHLNGTSLREDLRASMDTLFRNRL